MTAPSNYRTWPLPTNIPTTTRCVQLELPDDPYFFKQFYGMLDQATQWFSYDRDTAHTGAQAAKLWKRVIASIQECPECTPTAPGFSVGEDMQIKQDPANPCLVREVCPDGSLGCVVIDISKCLTNPAPGGGTTPPSAGNCQEYNINFFANALTILPFLVNTGDVLTMTSLTGAGNDGTPTWFCADGEQFVAGACVGGMVLTPTDPLPTQFHMCTVLKVNGLYYKWTTGAFTVPSGVTNLPIYIGVNDAPIDDNTGTYLVDFTYCNNAAVSTPWCAHLDFTATPQGFSALTGIDGNGQVYGPAVWSSGQGWILHPQQPPPATTMEYYCLLRIDLGANYTINYAAVAGHVGNATGGVLPEEVDVIFNTADTTGGGAVGLVTGVPSRNADFALTNSPTPYTGRYLFVYSIGYGLTSPTDPILIIKNLTLKGTGVNPFGTSNC